MTYEYTIRVLPEVAANEQQLKAYLVREKGLDEALCQKLRKHRVASFPFGLFFS